MNLIKWILILALTVIIGISLAQFFPGEVLILAGGWSIQTSLLFLMAGIVGFYFLIHGTVWLWRMPARKAQRYFEQRAQAQLELGMLAMAEGDWKKAERALSRSASGSRKPAVSYIAAAQAAQGEGAEQRRTEYLKQAETSTEAQHSVAITRAQLLLREGHTEQALEILHRQEIAHRPRALELLLKCFERTGRWSECVPYLAPMMKAGVIDSARARHIDQLALAEILANAQSDDELAAQWQSVPRGKRKEPELVEEFARAALRTGDGSIAATDLSAALDRQFNEQLAALYARLPHEDVSAETRRVEKWLSSHPKSAALHFLLGRLCARNQLWAKARENLEQAAALGSVAATAELGKLHESLGEMEKAMRAYRDGLEQALK